MTEQGRALNTTLNTRSIGGAPNEPRKQMIHANKWSLPKVNTARAHKNGGWASSKTRLSKRAPWCLQFVCLPLAHARKKHIWAKGPSSVVYSENVGSWHFPGSGAFWAGRCVVCVCDFVCVCGPFSTRKSLNNTCVSNQSQLWRMDLAP